MTSIAVKKGLKVTGLVTDLYAFDDYRDFDSMLLDSMFHFEKRDKQKEVRLIQKIAKQLTKNGLMCICIQDIGKKVKILKESIDNAGIDYHILNDSSLVYNYEDKVSGHKSKTKYGMYIVKKDKNTTFAIQLVGD